MCVCVSVCLLQLSAVYSEEVTLHLLMPPFTVSAPASIEAETAECWWLRWGEGQG